jgi:hypothetical protein
LHNSQVGTKYGTGLQTWNLHLMHRSLIIHLSIMNPNWESCHPPLPSDCHAWPVKNCPSLFSFLI